MAAVASHQYLTVVAASLLAAFGYLAYVGVVSTQPVLVGVAFLVFGVVSFYVGRFSVDIGRGHGKRT